MKNIKLSNGVEIPAVGYGCYDVVDNGYEIFLKAVECGYRHFDIAAFYGNEDVLGRAIKDCGVPREDLFITTKLWRESMEDPGKELTESLKKLQLDYIDLYLIHWPRPMDMTKEWRELDRKAWKFIEEQYKAGTLKAIGVSNFHPHHLMNLAEIADIMPMVNQLEYHPGYIQDAAVRYCKERNIVVEAWSPLGRGRVANEPLLLELSKKYGVSPQKICLRFAVQNEIIPIPKSSTEERMRDNLDAFGFDISEEDMCRIRCMPQTGWSGEHPDRENE